MGVSQTHTLRKMITEPLTGIEPATLWWPVIMMIISHQKVARSIPNLWVRNRFPEDLSLTNVQLGNTTRRCDKAVMNSFYHSCCCCCCSCLDMSIHWLIVRMDLLTFDTPLKVILTQCFVLTKQNWNFNRKHNEKLFRYNLGCCQFVAKLCVCVCVWVFFISFTLPVTVRTICRFDDFEKLSILLEFSRNYWKGGRGFVAYAYF